MENATKASNKEQEKVIHKLKEVLNFLESTQIKNEESLENLRKPLDDLLNSVKYLPTEPSFNIVPAEIKTAIFSYLCNSGAFVAASVCTQWKDILNNRLKDMDCVTVGHYCSNKFECEEDECFMPEEILEASIVLKLDIPLTICYFIQEVDPNLIAEAVANVSKFSMYGDCGCVDEDDADYGSPLMTKKQMKHLMKTLQKKGKIMEEMCLEAVNLTYLDQDRLIDYLLNNVKHLTLNEGGVEFMRYCKILDIERFVRKLLEKDELNLSRLTLINMRYVDYLDMNMSEDLADALCKVETVDLASEFPSLTTETVERLIQNILTRDVRMKSLLIMKHFDWRSLISSEDLKSVIIKMKKIDLFGKFTQDQVEAVKALPGVKADLKEITKSPPEAPETTEKIVEAEALIEATAESDIPDTKMETAAKVSATEQENMDDEKKDAPVDGAMEAERKDAHVEELMETEDVPTTEPITQDPFTDEKADEAELNATEVEKEPKECANSDKSF